MRFIKRAKFFLSFDMKMKLLLVEAFLLLGWARILKGKSFKKIAPSLGDYMVETSFKMEESSKKILKNISDAVTIMSRNTTWESMCLVQAIAAMKMLERRNIESTIYFGTSKDKTGKLIAHAWLRSGPFYITGADGMNQFVVVSKFAKKNKVIKH
jgi:hypothetical protein